VPRIKIPYRVKTTNGYTTRTYFKPDMAYIQDLAKKLPLLPNITVPIMSVDESIENMKDIIEKAVNNNRPVAEKDLNGPMTHLIANYLMKAAPDLDIFILPSEYLTSMYAEPQKDFFLIEWFNAQRHPRVDSTTAVIEIHLDADGLGLGNCAYPIQLGKNIGRNGMAQYSHFLEYRNTEIWEIIKLGDLVRGNPDFLKIHLSRIMEVVKALRISQPNVTKIALIFGHSSPGYKLLGTGSLSTGTFRNYKRGEASFINNNVVRWDDILMNEANRINRTWLNKYGITAKTISDLEIFQVLAHSEGSYPYVHFTREILLRRLYGKDGLFDKMQRMGWNKNDLQWKGLELAFRKHAYYILTPSTIDLFDLHEAIKAVGWPVDTTDYQTVTSDSTATINQEINSAA
jgi:hypothetical protein